MNCCQDCKNKKVGARLYESIRIDRWSSADLKRKTYLCNGCLLKHQEALRKITGKVSI